MTWCLCLDHDWRLWWCICLYLLVKLLLRACLLLFHLSLLRWLGLYLCFYCLWIFTSRCGLLFYWAHQCWLLGERWTRWGLYLLLTSLNLEFRDKIRRCLAVLLLDARTRLDLAFSGLLARTRLDLNLICRDSLRHLRFILWEDQQILRRMGSFTATILIVLYWPFLCLRHLLSITKVFNALIIVLHGALVLICHGAVHLLTRGGNLLCCLVHN